MRRLCLIFLPICCTTAWSTTIHVPGEAATMAAALIQSVAGDSVVVAPGVYHEHDLSIQHPLTLMGENPDDPQIVIDGDGHHILTIANGGMTTQLQGLTFQNAHFNSGGGGAIELDETEALTVRDCRFVSNYGGYGSALHVGASAGALVRNCIFEGGDAQGGSCISNQGDCTLIDCEFSGFVPVGSFQAKIIYQWGSRPLRLFNCDFHDNGGGSWGRLIASGDDTGPVQLEDCLFIHNVVDYLIDQGYNNSAELLRCRFDYNECRTLLALEGSLTGCLVRDNHSDGVALASNGLQLVDCVLLANTVENKYSSLIEGSAVALTGCTLLDNRCPDPLLWTSQGSLVRCLVIGNDCPALVRSSSTLDEVTCTDSYANICADWGGPLEPFAGIQGNFSANPRLRDLESDDLRPALGSPARPEGNTCGQLIGALAPVDEAPAPMALFAVSVVGGAMPLSVDFHALDGDVATSWAWDFDEDQSPDGFGADVSWTFTQHGRHDVTLVAGDGNVTRARTRADVVAAGGAVLRVPEDLESMVAALAAALPADTVDLACGDHLLAGVVTIPWGVILRGRTAGGHCSRIVFQEESVFLGYLVAEAGPLPCHLLDLELNAHSTSGFNEAELQGYMSSLRLENCGLSGDLQCNISEGTLLALNCRMDSLSTVVDGMNASVELVGCRLDNCGVLGEGYFSTLNLQDCELKGSRLLLNDYDGSSCQEMTLSTCTLLDCGAGLIAGSIVELSLERDLFVSGAGGLVGDEAEIDQLSVSGCDIWNHPGGNWTGPLASHAGIDGNIEADPFFCDPESGGLGLAWNSPCVIDSSSGIYMGAHGLDCQLSIPMAAYQASPELGAAPLSVDFHYTGLGETTDLQWDLDGDGEDDAAGADVTHVYSAPGVYQPRLRSIGPGGQDEFQGALIRAGGRTIRVPEDQPALAAALAVAAAGDTVVVGCGVWYEHDLDLPAGVFLKGAGPVPCAILDGQTLGGILGLEQNADENRIEDLAFRHGNGHNWGGAIDLGYSFDPGLDGTLLLRRCLFTDNTAGYGGAVGALNGNMQVQVDSCEFVDNSAPVYGGAVDVERVVVTNSRFQGNEAGTGGAIHGNGMVVENCELVGNSAEDGGALAGEYDVTARHCRFSNNRADNKGGAIFTQYASTQHSSVIENCLFHHNRAVVNGGAVYDVSLAQVDSCTFYADSTSVVGGVLALHVYSGTPQVNGCILAASMRGRSMSVGSATPLISCTDMWGNQGLNWPAPLDQQLGLRGNIEANPLFCRPDLLDFGLHEDSPCLPAQSDCGWMGGVFATCPGTGVPSDPVEPLRFALHPAAPNPFNPRTLLRFDLERAGPVRLRLFNLLGQQVRVLVDEELPAGSHQRMLEGDALASGVYLLRLQAGSVERQQKILLVK